MYNVINEGSAFWNGIGEVSGSSERFNTPSVYEYEDHISIEQPEVHISANGNVCFCCDLSYESQEEDRFGNIKEQSMLEIIRIYQKYLQKSEAV